MSADRPRLFYVDVEDPDRAFDDPGLAQLARVGWTVAHIHRIVVSDKSGDTERLMVVLWPPPDPPAVSVLVVASHVVWLLAGVAWLLAMVWEVR